MGEYDIENDYWVAAECHINDNFLAFSKVVYLPNQDSLVMGGLDDSVPNKPSFVNKVVSLTELPMNIYESVYSPTTLASMKTKRGCFSAIYSHGTQLVYVFGGLNYADKILKKCEVYNL